MQRFIIVLFLAIFSVSCSTAFKVDSVPLQYRKTSLIYFVENHGRDKRHLEKIIASELQKRGFNVLSGYESDRPAKIDVLVVYEDRWQWDMTNYLIFMRIDMRSPTTHVLFATGSSYQSSLARKPEDEVIGDIMSSMFAK